MARGTLPRLLAGLDSSGEPMTLADHERVHGPCPAHAPAQLIELVDRSGLRGRGGADFPTARKLRTLASARGRERVVLINGSETEPASAKDRLLLGRLPHLVLDGAVLAAEAIGAQEVIVKVSDRMAAAISAVEGAIAVRDDFVPIQLVHGPGGYVSGEESAVVSYLNGGQPKPMFVPPRPFERGVGRRPTLVNNPETFAQLALVARHGDTWFRELGTDADPGSALVTISGAVAAPGVYELSFGTPMTALVEAAGGPSESLRALLVGGYFGTWVEAASALRLRLAREDLRSVGCTLGSGVVIALGESSCGVHESARVIDYLAQQSAAQCGPCVHGLRAIADAVIAITDGKAGTAAHERILRWTAEIRGRGACHHPDGAARFIESALTVFADELEAHRHGRCKARPAGLPLGPAPVHGHKPLVRQVEDPLIGGFSAPRSGRGYATGARR
jgi:NADH:ubiquinone oxidoreductase subunit F (NADH-binding)